MFGNIFYFTNEFTSISYILIHFVGTRAFMAKNQFLFQRTNCSMVDVIAENKPLTSSEKFEMKLKEKELKERGKKVSIWGGRMILTFDVNTYKVINFESDWGLKAFKEHFMDLQIP